MHNSVKGVKTIELYTKFEKRVIVNKLKNKQERQGRIPFLKQVSRTSKKLAFMENSLGVSQKIKSG